MSFIGREKPRISFIISISAFLNENGMKSDELIFTHALNGFCTIHFFPYSTHTPHVLFDFLLPE